MNNTSTVQAQHQFKYLCAQNPSEITEDKLYNAGVKLNFTNAYNSKSYDITFDFDNLNYGKDTTIQDSMVNIATRQGSNLLNEDEGTTLQEDTLNYALASSNYLTHTCNFAGSDTKFFENNYVEKINSFLNNLNAENVTDMPDSLVVSNSTYVNSITDLKVTPYKFQYDMAILTLQFRFDDGSIIGEIELATQF